MVNFIDYLLNGLRLKSPLQNCNNIKVSRKQKKSDDITQPENTFISYLFNEHFNNSKKNKINKQQIDNQSDDEFNYEFNDEETEMVEIHLR